MKGFVFDLDNTLYDRYATIRKLFELGYEEFRPYINPAYSFERACEHLCHTESLFVFFGGWKGWYDHLVEERFFNSANTPDYEVFSDFLKRGFSNVACHFPFTMYVLEKLKSKGYKLAILTNAVDSEFQNQKIDLLSFRHLFDAIVISGDYAETACGDRTDNRYYKPNPAPFLHVAELLGEKPEDLFYVGDNPIADVTGARNSGFVPVWIRSKSPWILENELIPELVFDDIEELLNII